MAPWLGGLIRYYTLLQVLHILVIAKAGWDYATLGSIGFPALPPGRGWTPEEIGWLVGNGVLDLVVALIALCSALQYARSSSGWGVAGLVALTGSVYSAGIFAFGTLPTGAWASHPIHYSLLALLFVPVVFLFAGMFRRISRFHKINDPQTPVESAVAARGRVQGGDNL